MQSRGPLGVTQQLLLRRLRLAASGDRAIRRVQIAVKLPRRVDSDGGGDNKWSRRLGASTPYNRYIM
jgi:hypothetical protein